MSSETIPVVEIKAHLSQYMAIFTIWNNLMKKPGYRIYLCHSNIKGDCQ